MSTKWRCVPLTWRRLRATYAHFYLAQLYWKQRIRSIATLPRLSLSAQSSSVNRRSLEFRSFFASTFDKILLAAWSPAKKNVSFAMRANAASVSPSPPERYRIHPSVGQREWARATLGLKHYSFNENEKIGTSAIVMRRNFKHYAPRGEKHPTIVSEHKMAVHVA